MYQYAVWHIMQSLSTKDTNHTSKARIIIIIIIIDEELYFHCFRYAYDYTIPWMVNSIPSPMATSSWLSSLALFLSLYASNSPSARSRSPSRSIPSAQSYKISNPPLLGNSYRKTNRNALKIIRNAVQIKIHSPCIQIHQIYVCDCFPSRFPTRQIEESDQISNMIMLFACNRIWCRILCLMISPVIRSGDGVSMIYNVDALRVILAALTHLILIWILMMIVKHLNLLE